MFPVEALDTRDVTDRAVAGGWVLPDGWTVRADLTRDDSISDIEKEFDCYSEAQVAAWKNDDWVFVVVSLWVQDQHGREWGSSIIGGTEYGHMPNFEGDDTVVLDPLEDGKLAEDYSIIREHDMIGEALRDAVAQLEAFGTPIIVEPAGDTVTGL